MKLLIFVILIFLIGISGCANLNRGTQSPSQDLSITMKGGGSITVTYTPSIIQNENEQHNSTEVVK